MDMAAHREFHIDIFDITGVLTYLHTTTVENAEFVMKEGLLVPDFLGHTSDEVNSDTLSYWLNYRRLYGKAVVVIQIPINLMRDMSYAAQEPEFLTAVVAYTSRTTDDPSSPFDHLVPSKYIRGFLAQGIYSSRIPSSTPEYISRETYSKSMERVKNYYSFIFEGISAVEESEDMAKIFDRPGVNTYFHTTTKVAAKSICEDGLLVPEYLGHTTDDVNPDTAGYWFHYRRKHYGACTVVIQIPKSHMGNYAAPKEEFEKVLRDHGDDESEFALLVSSKYVRGFFDENGKFVPNPKFTPGS